MRLSLFVFAIVLSAGAFVLLAEETEATHLRGGTLNWKQVSVGQTETEVRFNGTIHWSYSSQGSPALGATCNSGNIQTPGYSPISYAQIAVAFDADPNENWVICKIVDPATLQDGVVGRFPNGIGPVTSSTSFSARISASSGHVNNPDQSQRLETTLDLRTPNNSPVLFMPPMFSCDPNMMCHIPIMAGDFEGDPLNFRLSTSAEAGSATFDQPGPPDAPNLITINQNVTPPRMEWDTTGATMSGCAGCPTLYSYQIMAEDLDANGTVMTKASADAFIRIEPADPPYWQVPPSVSDDGITCGGTVVGKQSRWMTWDVQAAHNNTNKDVRLFLSPITPLANLPGTPGLTFNSPNNPASATFTWTPPAGTAGNSYPLTFYAHTGPHYAKPCQVIIKVLPLIPPVPDFDCYTPSKPYLEIQFTDLSSDVDGNVTTLTWTWGDGQVNTYAPGGMYTHSYPREGWFNVTLTVTDDDNLSRSITKPCWAENNLPPVLDPPGEHVIGEGQTLTFTITGYDPDLDPVTFGWIPAGLPASATFDPTTQEFSWTPDNGMAGEYGPIPFEIRDFEFMDTKDAYITVQPAPKEQSGTMSDTDGDNIPDDRDNCPNDPNADQADADGNGLGDVCDSQFEPAQASEGGEETEEETVVPALEEDGDADKDGIVDSNDNCPFVKNADQANLDGDDLGDVCDADIDGDRVNQFDAAGKILDNCPFTPNSLQVDTDGDGVGDACQGDMDADGIPDDEETCPSGLCDFAEFVAEESTTDDEPVTTTRIGGSPDASARVPMLAGIGAVALIALGALVFVLVRRR